MTSEERLAKKLADRQLAATLAAPIIAKRIANVSTDPASDYATAKNVYERMLRTIETMVF